MKYVNPVMDLGRALYSVQNPARYLGGDFGQIIKKDAAFTFALAFPDLYEIGMSNLAVKILYDALNKISGVRCERVFAPAPDFEELLLARKIPLYTLESGIPLVSADIIGLSIGYEPGITGALSILNTGNIPLLCSERSLSDPIVLAGGCGITNPLPFSKFIDAFYIGEAEGGLFALVETLAVARASGASRDDLLNILEAHPAVWTARKNSARIGNTVCTHRAIYDGFGSSSDRAVCFPVPNLRIVQDQGVVEIMRGCPNGCRFCHAGMYYRPQRMMEKSRILSDVDFLINQAGYREISLMSLSSGDYSGIGPLLAELTGKYSEKHISFQLPSLKVNSFTLPLLAQLAEVRKSGLTFAVETPVDAWQLSLNKEVFRDHIISIMRQAKQHGWSSAKFYFMIGLPVETPGKSDAQEIANFLLEIQAATRIQCSVNIGTFIPKPHTPYQWAKQLSITEATAKLDIIKQALPRGKFKVGAHRPFNSFMEGMLSRGDERVGDIILKAWKNGCRLDAWDDWAKPDVWRDAITTAGWDVETETLRERSTAENLPWDGISLGPSKAYLIKELTRSNDQQLTPRCAENCLEPCGICGTKHALNVLEEPIVDQESSGTVPLPSSTRVPGTGPAAREPVCRIVLSFSKSEDIAFVPHLGLIEVWNKAFQRADLPVVYTEGFNPLPRFEIAQSLSMGVSSECEIASFMLYEERSEQLIIEALNRSLPVGLRIRQALVYPTGKNVKREALSVWLWGNEYQWNFYEATDALKLKTDQRVLDFLQITDGMNVEFQSAGSWFVHVPFKADRKFRDLVAEITGVPIYELVKIHKLKTLANDTVKQPCDFFEFVSGVAAAAKQALQYS